MYGKPGNSTTVNLHNMQNGAGHILNTIFSARVREYAEIVLRELYTQLVGQQ